MKICVGVCGSIAAYRSPDLVKELVQRGHDVQVVLTASAKEFVSDRVLSTFSGNVVHFDDLFDSRYRSTEHIELARWADRIVVYGATANFLAKVVNGFGDDLLSLQILAAKCPVFLAPAMNPAMWSNPAVQENRRKALERGIGVIGPIAGVVACGESGIGHIAETKAIVDKVVSLGETRAGAFASKTVLISAGPMRSSIDSVRYMQNRSSGKMGLALARTAALQGAKVQVLLGPVEQSMAREFDEFEVIRYAGPTEYGEQLLIYFPKSDYFFSLAAVLDFEFLTRSGKIEREALANRSELDLGIRSVRDYVAYMASLRKPGQKVIAFAAESGTPEEIVTRAQSKMKKKGVDALIANPVWPDLGPEADQNEIWILRPGQEPVHIGPSPKTELAEPILRAALEC